MHVASVNPEVPNKIDNDVRGRNLDLARWSKE